MSNIKKLSIEEMGSLSGAGQNNGQSGYESDSRTCSTERGSYSGVDSCGAGIFGGLVAGSPGGPIGMAAGIVGGMIAGQCTTNSFSSGNGRGCNNNSNSNSRSNSGSFGGQCTW